MLKLQEVQETATSTNAAQPNSTEDYSAYDKMELIEKSIKGLNDLLTTHEKQYQRLKNQLDSLLSSDTTEKYRVDYELLEGDLHKTQKQFKQTHKDLQSLKVMISE